VFFFLKKIADSHFWLKSDTNTRNRLLTKYHTGDQAGFKTLLKQHNFREKRWNA
jgi:hypothetical protein